MKFFFAVAFLVATASAAPMELPAGVTCPNWPLDCELGGADAAAAAIAAPASLPVPIVNGQPVAPIINALPDQAAIIQQASD